MQRYSQREIKEAGKLIRGSHPHATPELIEAYRVAHSWREAHIEPMRRTRSELAKICRRHGWTLTAGRLKRFQSIRRKLRRLPHSLYYMQDIAGCRAIVGDMRQVDELTRFYLDGRSEHEFISADPYISAPKRGGYRSNHVVLKFVAPDEVTGGNRLTVEVQLRTQLQHAWATAVEAVGLVRNEDLKSGGGNEDWLRFFEIMSSEFAEEEKQPLVPGVSEVRKERRAELIDLEHRLDATRTMIGYNRAIKEAQDIRGLSGQSYLIDFDSDTMTVSVRTYSTFALTSRRYLEGELGEKQRNTVLVEVDKVGDLCTAYPNYFMDVRLFTDRLTAYAFPEGRQRESRPDLAVKRKQSAKWGDLSWLRNYDFDK